MPGRLKAVPVLVCQLCGAHVHVVTSDCFGALRGRGLVQQCRRLSGKSIRAFGQRWDFQRLQRYALAETSLAGVRFSCSVACARLSAGCFGGS